MDRKQGKLSLMIRMRLQALRVIQAVAEQRQSYFSAPMRIRPEGNLVDDEMATSERTIPQLYPAIRMTERR